MTPPGQRASDPSTRASILLVCGLIALLAVFPPETRGESMAGAAALIAAIALLRPLAFAEHRGIWLLAAAGIAGIAAGSALAPGAAIEPLAIVVLAVALGLASSTLGPTLITNLTRWLAAGAAVAGAHASYQRLWGLERMARLVADQPTLPDREAILIRIEQGRAFAAFPTPAALGGLLALALPVSVALALAARGRSRGVWWGCVALQVAGLLAAASATASTALLLALGLAWFARGGSRRARLAAVAAATLLLLLVVGLRGGALTDLHAADSPWRLRAGNMRVAGEMALEHPLLGVGPGGYGEIYAQYQRPGDNETRHAHDLPLELVAEWGLPLGLALTAGFFGLFFVPLVRMARRPADSTSTIPAGLSIGLAAFALHNLADFTAFLPSLLWLAAAARGALRAAEPGAADAERRPVLQPALAAASVAVCVVAALAAAGSGLGRDARVAARAAAWDDRLPDAERLIGRALSRAPWDIDATSIASSIALDGPGGREQALLLADRAVRLSPVRAALRGARARIRAESGDAPGALADLDEAVRRSPRVGEYTAAAERFRSTLARSIATAGGGA